MLMNINERCWILWRCFDRTQLCFTCEFSRTKPLAPLICLFFTTKFYKSRTSDVVWFFFKGFHSCIIQDNKCNKSPVCVCVCVLSHVRFVWLHGLLSTRLFCPWARILEWVAISFSRESSLPEDQTCASCVFCIGRWILYHCTIWKSFY